MLYCSWDMACDRCNYFSFWAIFYPFTPLRAPLQKKKKTTGDSIILHKRTKIMTIGYTVPEIWHVTDVIIFHYGLFFVLLPPPFPPPYNSQKNENFKKKKKKMPADIIILHKCTKTHDHKLYYSSDMVHDECNCSFSFWANLFPFTP